MIKMNRILVPVDFSKEAELAVEWAVKLAKEEKDATLYLLHVIPFNIVIPESGYEMESLIAHNWETAKANLGKWQRKVPPPLTAVPLCGKGDLVQEISSVIENESIDLVVMTTHGRQGLSRVVHPNVTEKVVRSAYCPVLVLHMNQRTEALAKK